MSHFHFVSTQAYGRRVEQLGEDPARVSVCGAPALDNLSQIDFMSASELEHAFGINLAEPPLLVTFHPTTLDVENTESDTEALLSAIREIGLPVIFTLPNADTAGRRIIELITEYVSADETAFLVPNFGLRGYYSALNFVRAMVGNTSSGIIEAASFTLPVVDIGDRQRGRITGRNVIHAPARRSAVANAIREALSDPFVQSLNDMRNPYGDGNASETIVAKLKSVDLGADLIKKRFYDLPNPGSVERR